MKLFIVFIISSFYIMSIDSREKPPQTKNKSNGREKPIRVPSPPSSPNTVGSPRNDIQLTMPPKMSRLLDDDNSSIYEDVEMGQNESSCDEEEVSKGKTIKEFVKDKGKELGNVVEDITELLGNAKQKKRLIKKASVSGIGGIIILALTVLLIIVVKRL